MVIKGIITVLTIVFVVIAVRTKETPLKPAEFPGTVGLTGACDIFIVAGKVLGHNDSTQCPNILKRSQWGGRQSTGVNYLIVPIPFVVIHHTVTDGCSTLSECSQIVVNIQNHHMTGNGWHDIGYSFLIGGDGNVYEGVGWTREGAHTYGYNKRSIGIAFIGSFENNNASQTMLDAAHKLITCGKAQGVLRSNVRVIGGRQAGATLSPGLALYNQIQAWPEWVATP